MGKVVPLQGLYSATGCEGGEHSSCLSCYINLHCLLSRRSLLEQLRKLQALVRQSTTKTTTASTCIMVSIFSPRVCDGGVSVVSISLAGKHLLQLMMPIHVFC